MKVLTGKVRASYVNVFHPRMNDLSEKEEYSMQILIKKDDKVTLDRIEKAIDEALKEEWPEKRPENLRFPLKDGDEKDDETYAGCWYMNVKSYSAPGILDRQSQDVIDESEFVSGDYCRCTINSKAYNKKVNRGVSFWVNNIQVLERGEPLKGGKARAADDFPDDLAAERKEENPFG